MNKNKICCIFNLAAHYRAPIYNLMDKNLKCDFFISQWKINPFKQMNFQNLKGFIGSGGVIFFKKFYWQKNTISLIFKQYDKFLMTGEPYSISSWVILLLSKFLNKKVYLWSHGFYGNESKIKKVIKHTFFNLSAKVFVYGNHSRNLMINNNFNPKKVFLIYNSLDYNLHISLRNKFYQTPDFLFGNNDPYILYIGRIQKIKKIGLLIDAFSDLISENIKCNLLIIGPNSDNINFNIPKNNKKLDNRIKFYGQCYDEKLLSKIISNSFVCVSPGNVGLTAIHCLSFGTPVITHNNFNNQMPEFEAITHRVNGSFFIEDSIKDLKNEILYWLNKNRLITRNACYEVIDKYYNPNNQLKIFKNELL